ncbi:MAG TPA: response regulator transcription factor [Solirubrobacteraceae bacterium]|jgi:DNA-binding NarL/FixJ family response regulator|nr:response regulator transcription factor [Solirubrobacteraceae bacterium]
MSAELHALPPLAEAPAEETAERTVSVVIADDHALMRRSLRALLEREDDVAVVAEAEALAGAVERMRELAPDVLVLDMRLRDGSSIHAIGELREQAPDTRVVVVTAEDNPLYAEHALAAGALGFVQKDHADVELPAAIRAVVRGERYVSPHVEAKLASYRSIHVDDALTAREREVLG